MKYASERYLNINHPYRIGVIIQAIPTGKTRATDSGRIEAEGRIITPKANMDIIWFVKEDIACG